MSMEETQCAPYLPPNILMALKQEHQRIIASGFQRADLERHSQWEEALFRQHRVPPHVLHQIHTDHAGFENGRLRSRMKL